MVDPLPWMYSAIEAVGDGKVGEVEARWDTWSDETGSTTLVIIVRREVSHTILRRPDGGESEST